MSAAVVATPVLFVRRWRRRRTNKELEDILSRARGLQDPEKRRRVFFDVAHRFAANNGSPVNFTDSYEHKVYLDMVEEPTGACNITAIDPHNFRFAIHRKLFKWKVWVAVDAELDFSSYHEASSHSRDPTGADNDTDNAQSTLVRRALDEPLTFVIMTIMDEVFAKLRGQAKGSHHVPDEVDLEILVWDTVIPLNFNTRTLKAETHWVGKIGDSRPSRRSWVIIPLPFFFDS